MYSNVIVWYLPGKVQIRLEYLVPTTGLDNTARGVCLRPSFRRACATPGASLCSSGLMVSGVRSRTPKPVPPEVRTKSTARGLLGSVHWVIMLRMDSDLCKLDGL